MELNDFRQKLNSIVERLKGEVATLRASRASPALVEDLEVEYYGAKSPLKAVASISSPEPKTLVIQPWDKSILPAIEKAIQNSSLGLAPIADRDTIRLTIPPLTEERRREIAKLLSRHLEDARIQVRREREEALKELDRKERAKEISEDEKFRKKQEVQKTVDEVNHRIEEMGRAKEREIMAV